MSKIVDLVFKGKIEDEDYQKIAEEINACSEEDEIRLSFCSTGGDTQLIPIFVQLFNRVDHLIAYGEIMSSAFIIFLMTEPNLSKKIAPMTSFMYHRPSYSPRFPLNYKMQYEFEDGEEESTLGQVSSFFEVIEKCLDLTPKQSKLLKNSKELFYTPKKFIEIQKNYQKICKYGKNDVLLLSEIK